MNKNNKYLALSALFIALMPFLSYGTTLSQAVQTAVSNLPDVQIDQASEKANAQTIKQAKAGYLPVINGNAGYGTEHSVNAIQSEISNQGSGNNTLGRGEFGLDLTENVFDGFNTTYEVQRTKAETLAATEQVYGTANDMSLNVIEQYINVILQNKLVALSKQNVSSHYNIAGTITERKQAGVSGDSELSQANTRIDLAKSNLITQQSNLEDAQTEYQRYVGATPSNLAAPPTPAYPVIPRTEQQAIQIALQNQPVLKSANADIAGAIAQHNASKYTRYPKLDLVLEADDNNNIDGIEGPQDNYLAMARVNYNFFSGGANRAKQRETAFDTEKAIAIRNRTILQTEEAVRLAWTAMTNEQKRVATLATYRDNAATTFSSYSEEFKLNKRSLLDLLDTQNEVYQSNVSYQQARADELFARYRLLNAMGTLNRYLNTTVSVAAPVPENDVLPPPTHSNKTYSQTNYVQHRSKTSSYTMMSSAKPIKTSATNLAQSKGYALQLVSSPNKADLNRYISKYNLASKTVINPAVINGQQTYELFYGNYSTVSAAKTAVTTLPAGLQASDPIIRSIV